MTLAAIAAVAVVVSLLDPALQPLAGTASATDGDSLRLNGERIRLLGLDAPEYDQTCRRADGADWDCGRAARTELARLVKGAGTTCRPDGRDRYGRVLAKCETSGVDLGHAIVDAGLAVSEIDYKLAELAARGAGRGIWQGSFDTPADWRAYHGEQVEFDLLGWIRAWIAELGTMHLT